MIDIQTLYNWWPPVVSFNFSMMFTHVERHWRPLQRKARLDRRNRNHASKQRFLHGSKRIRARFCSSNPASPSLRNFLFGQSCTCKHWQRPNNCLAVCAIGNKSFQKADWNIMKSKHPSLNNTDNNARLVMSLHHDCWAPQREQEEFHLHLLQPNERLHLVHITHNSIVTNMWTNQGLIWSRAS